MSKSFSLSLELVLLMDWLLKNEKDTLKKMISKSLNSGLLKEIELMDTFSQEELLDIDSDYSQSLHDSILDFLMFMEDILVDDLETKDKKNFEPFQSTLQKINNQRLDDKTIMLSLKQTNHQSKNLKNKKANQDLENNLFSEILKNWTPKTNEPLN